MRQEHLQLLCCPKTKRPLEIQDARVDDKGLIFSGVLVEPISGEKYPIVNYLPRFVGSDNYANNFGFQWKLHRLTQHDQHSKFNVSENRFWKETGWSKNLKGMLILEAGCGSGRFTRFPVEAGATVVSFDYSQAVEENYKINGANPNLLMLQADIFNPPFKEGQFDKVFCFGVLQHTPDPEAAFFSLVKLLRKGGQIAADVYLKSILNYYLNPVYFCRRLTRNLNPEKLYRFVKGYVDALWPIVKVVRKVPLFGDQINRRILMVADRASQIPGAVDSTLREWAYLDTFDWLSPRYDIPQSIKTFRQWYSKAGFINIDVRRGYNGVEGRGELPPESNIN